MSLQENLDILLGWKKTRYEFRRDKCFIDYPHIIDFIESGLDEWVEEIKEELGDHYHFSVPEIINVPKSGWSVRPGSVLKIKDRVIYSALVLDLYEDIRDEISWSFYNCRFMHPLKKYKDKKGWFKGYRTDHWNEFRKISLGKLGERHDYVVFTDISGFYENIDIKRLASDLNKISNKTETIRLLKNCLHTFSGTRDRGLPQGCSPSDILAEFYLNSMDRRLKNRDIVHLRWSDDFRLFCKTKEQAIKHLKKFIELCRDRSLNLNTGKTEIAKQEKAKSRIKGASEEIEEIEEEIKEDTSEISYGNPYSAPSEIRFLRENRPDDFDSEYLKDKLEKRFQRNFLDGEEFDRSLFNFIIGRLGVLGSTIAIGYCVDLFTKRPQLTSEILRYMSELDEETVKHTMETVFDKRRMIYKYQRYLLVKFLFENRIYSEKLLDEIRYFLNSSNLIGPTENYCIAYLGKFGSYSDLEDIQRKYREANNVIKKAVVVYNLRRMEKGRRNSFYGRLDDRNHLIGKAIEKGKSFSHV